MRESRAARMLLDTIGGLRTPDQGTVLLPPSANVRTVAALPATHDERTVLQALRAGWTNSQAVADSTIWALCAALGMSQDVFSAEHKDTPLSHLALQLSCLDLYLIGLVRAIGAQPDILLLQAFEGLDGKRGRMLHAVLSNYASGAAPSE